VAAKNPYSTPAREQHPATVKPIPIKTVKVKKK
jgi:hypothetical protein